MPSDTMLLAHGLSEMLIGIGGLLLVFAVYPAASNARAVQFERAPDLSRLKLDITVARPNMLRVGAVMIGVGLMGSGLLNLLGMAG